MHSTQVNLDGLLFFSMKQMMAIVALALQVCLKEKMHPRLLLSTLTPMDHTPSFSHNMMHLRFNTERFLLNIPLLLPETNLVVLAALLLCVMVPTLMLWILVKEIQLDQVKELPPFLVFMALEFMHPTALIQDTLNLSITHFLHNIGITNLSHNYIEEQVFRVSRTHSRLRVLYLNLLPPLLYLPRLCLPILQLLFL